MRKIKMLLAAALALILTAGTAVTAFASLMDSVIDPGRTASLTVYKYDITAAVEAGSAEEGSLTATGQRQTGVEDRYGSWAVPGVVFTYLKIGEIDTWQAPDGGKFSTIYGIRSDVEKILGLNADTAVTAIDGVNYYYSEDINAAVRRVMGLGSGSVKTEKANPSEISTKNSLEALVRKDGTAMPATDESGRTAVSDLALGLYLVVETSVPDHIDRTAIPFIVSLPMTNVEGTAWNYDVFVYPKNESDTPELKKEVKEITEAPASGGVYSDTATASAGDTVQYQIVSNLPEITSYATRITKYTFTDTLSAGISYAGGDVTASWTDADGEVLAGWAQDDEEPKFTVDIADGENGSHVMTIAMTEAGLAEINPVYKDGRQVSAGYSRGTVTITYQARVNTDGSAVLGDAANPNNVKLEWSRSNTSYVGKLEDDAKVYTYGLDVTKQFRTVVESSDLTKVQFVLHNDTDDYYVAAEASEPGIYHVTGTADEKGAAALSPAADGSLRILGLEDDTYTLTEKQTDAGYILLTEGIEFTITSEAVHEEAESAGAYNDMHHLVKDHETGHLTDVTKESGHHSNTASASVNGTAVEMTADGTSEGALLPMTIINDRGIDIPKTGESGTFLLPMAGFICGALILGAALGMRRKAD